MTSASSYLYLLPLVHHVCLLIQKQSHYPLRAQNSDLPRYHSREARLPIRSPRLSRVRRSPAGDRRDPIRWHCRLIAANGVVQAMISPKQRMDSVHASVHGKYYHRTHVKYETGDESALVSFSICPRSPCLFAVVRARSVSYPTPYRCASPA